jgi:hypothetical protein
MTTETLRQVRTSEPRLFSIVVPKGAGAVKYWTTYMPTMIRGDIVLCTSRQDAVNAELLERILAATASLAVGDRDIARRGLAFHAGMSDDGEWLQHVSDGDGSDYSFFALDRQFHLI